ncbi:PfkB family carbohydrate kinase [Telluribacter sp. SYSU D00476]|uniref:PfkB family carbohydrate kinase n=1 Tax=Telluribacter sp. SYSU D00476 TaxID=2811430 RepID=UPI001FF508A2|nr:PfkB family carbohydrate kinase [Telluribacter sp. SYSU D00476]
MDQGRLQTILEKIRLVRIAVYGDFCLDAYWIMDKPGTEISIETGLPVETVARHYYSPGGAANVVANLSALNPAGIKVIGVVGDDLYGRELTAQLQSLGADTTSLVVQKDHFSTYTYLKKYVDGQEEPRVDFGVSNQRSEATDQLLLQGLETALSEYDAVIFNQQVVGSISNESFIQAANGLFERYHDKIVMLDSRHFNDRFHHTYRKANDKETAALCGVEVGSAEAVPIKEVRKYGQEVYSKSKKPVFVTCGARGIIAFDAEGAHEVPGLQLTGRLDTVGAGDTVISAVTLCLAAGIEAKEAAQVANFAAAVTVQKLFITGTASGEEILAIGQHPDYVYQADLADNVREARYLPDSEFELCDPAVLDRLGKVRHAVFDHDGTISTLRQGWEEIMESVMLKAILGSQHDTLDQGTFAGIQAQVKEFIHKTTGIQTIFQMEGLAQMVREAGYVPEAEVLDKFQYKQIYNEALIGMVSKRLAKLEAGELQPEDFMMKGVADFLRELRRRGVVLYLASGTDVDDVIHEARALGYADLFDGGIYGALRDYTKFSKRMVIERIIRENGLEGHELVAFGDGPDEMREARRFGGIAVGIASNEIRRYGHNHEKRPRLIKAGAQLLIPDFTQQRQLLQLLFKEKVDSMAV